MMQRRVRWPTLDPKGGLFDRMGSRKASSPKDLLAALDHFAAVVSVSDLGDLLNLVTANMPRLTDGLGCSIYLHPEFVPQFDGTLLDADGTPCKAADVPVPFIVVAATSRTGGDRLIGKAFYRAGEGLTGWVYGTGRLLCLRDSADPAERAKTSPDLVWEDKYRGSTDYYSIGTKKPILIAPLLVKNKAIGVLKIPGTATQRPFTRTSQSIVELSASVIASTIHKSNLINEQMESIQQLAAIGAKSDPRDVLAGVTSRLAALLGRRTCQLFLRDETGSRVRLAFENGREVTSQTNPGSACGSGAIKQVFISGRPLRTGGPDSVPRGGNDSGLLPTRADPFLAAPIRENGNITHGVLCVFGASARESGHPLPFTNDDLRLAESFASTISLAIAHDRQRLLAELLTNMGTISDPELLFNLVIEQVPKLITGTGCAIYQLDRIGSDVRLALVKSSRVGVIGNVERSADLPADTSSVSPSVYYRLGEGKTGFSASVRATLVVNHYGDAAGDLGLLDRRANAVSCHRSSVVHDCDGRDVGMAYLRTKARTSHRAATAFDELTAALVVGKRGLPTPRAEQYDRLSLPRSWSFVAVPIQHEMGDVYGVITIGRPEPSTPFAEHDVILLESIAGRLAAVLQNLRAVKEREHVLMTLAHEINTPLEGVLADSSSLVDEVAQPELRELAAHNRDLVLRLHLQTETIMAVLEEGVRQRELSVHSIFRPLTDACEMFDSEAKAKGCDIRRPKSGTTFPDMEMYLFDLTNAFKNIVHNAVKYSFRVSATQETNRYVSIEGRWKDRSLGLYSVSIQNYGVGILEEEIRDRRIFEPHYRGKAASDRRRTGAGFGLAHARYIIEELHGGDIDVDSKPLAGGAHLTTFTVTLPIRQERKRES